MNALERWSVKRCHNRECVHEKRWHICCPFSSLSIDRKTIPNQPAMTARYFVRTLLRRASLVPGALCHWYPVRCVTGTRCTVSLVPGALCHWYPVHCVTGTQCAVSLVPGALCHWYPVHCVTGTPCAMSLVPGGLCHWYLVHYVTGTRHAV